jgi:hypothetical protein
VAVTLLATYAAWSYLSIVWADEQGLAWDGANRTALYAIVLALFALWPVRGAPALFLIAVYALGVAGIGLVELLRAQGASQSIQYFYEGRLSEPTGYTNANVELFFSGFWPCIVLAARREVPVALRSIALGAAGLLTCLAVMGQSRGWLFLMPVAVIVFVALVPGRGRNIAALAAVGIGMALTVAPVLAVYNDFRPFKPPGEAYASAVHATLLLSGALALVGLVAAVVDRRVEAGPVVSRRVSAGMVCLLVALSVAAMGVVDVRRGNPVTLASNAWSEFKAGGTDASDLKQRFRVTLATYRYDYWRVAFENFQRAPLIGVGADNYGRDYQRKGKSIQTPRYPHNVVLRAMSETGLIGTALLGGSIAAALCAAAMALRRGRRLIAPVAGVAVVGFAYWVMQGLLDWFWEFAGLGAPAFAMLGLAAGLGAAARPEKGRGDRVPRATALAVGGLTVALLVGGMAVPWLAERQLRLGRATASSDPALALQHLRTAASLNPLSPDAQRTAALIEVRQGHNGRAEVLLRRSSRRSPPDAFSVAELSAIASVRMRQAEARRLADEALRLAPRNVVVQRVHRRIRRGKAVGPGRVIDWAFADLNGRIGPE